MSTCPHCDEQVPDQPEHWGWIPPWQCSFCAGLFGYGEKDTFRIQADFKPIRYLMNPHQAGYWAQLNSGNSPYVYALCYPNGIPFYVGKGRALRMIQHSRQVRGGKTNSEKERVLLRLIKEEVDERYAILAICDTDSEALDMEANIIDSLGRREDAGMLTNIDGYSRTVPAWCLPTQPAIKVDGRHEVWNWVSHVDVTTLRRYSHKGVIMTCPSCEERCFHPGNIVLRGARCPNCCFLLGVDGEEIREFWLNNRPGVNQTVELAAPLEEKPKSRDEPSARHIRRFWRR